MMKFVLLYTRPLLLGSVRFYNIETGQLQQMPGRP